MKKSITLILVLVLLFFGCSRSDVYSTVAKTIQEENVTTTQKNSYEFTYSGSYWRPWAGREKAELMLYTLSPLKSEKQLISLDHETILLTESTDGEYDCDLLTTDNLGYEKTG
ncbi:MAG: hypothetical protein Q7S22_00930 [Candidatus Micrarchaeota archaeon]|nr:hypothetical protein [Candidatus Micrarchaeota archaeon]